MNLIYKSSQSSMQTYLTIESENKTYRIMDLEKNSYDMTSSKTDLTKSIKFLAVCSIIGQYTPTGATLVRFQT